MAGTDRLATFLTIAFVCSMRWFERKLWYNIFKYEISSYATEFQGQLQAA